MDRKPGCWWVTAEATGKETCPGELDMQGLPEPVTNKPNSQPWGGRAAGLIRISAQWHNFWGLYYPSQWKAQV